MRRNHSFFVKIIAESVNLIQMSKQKIIMTMIENSQVLIKNYISKHRAKSFKLQETKDSDLLYLTKTAPKRTSNAIFHMKIVDLDES